MASFGIRHAPARPPRESHRDHRSDPPSRKLAVVGDHARGFRKAFQGRDVATPVVIDDLESAARRMGDEHATGRRLEGSVIK